MMPHRDGLVGAADVRTTRKLSPIPVIILSIIENKGLGFSLGAAD